MSYKTVWSVGIKDNKISYKYNHISNYHVLDYNGQNYYFKTKKALDKRINEILN